MAFLVVTVDTEEDSPRWKPERLTTLHNVYSIGKLQDLFDKYSIRPTYLVTYPVATDVTSVKSLKAIVKGKKCEIGAHLHPWNTPPLSEDETLRLSYPHRLKADIEKQKLEALTKAIRDSFDVQPVSYRAGRFGFDEESLRMLEEEGYLVDTSVTPFISWHQDGGPSFIGAPVKPYRLSYTSVLREGDARILEVPVTIRPNHNPGPFLYDIYQKMPGYVKGGLRKTGLIKVLWLRPTYSSAEEMVYLSDLTLGEGTGILNMMFHSNELIVGGSPYNQSTADIEAYRSKLDKVFDYLINSRNMTSKTLCETCGLLLGGK